MTRLTQKELKQLKQVGGSPVAALLVVAGIGLVLGSIIMMSSGYYIYGTGSTIVTTPGQTVIVNNPPAYGYDPGLGFAAGVVVGDAISDAAEHLPQNQSGGWVKHDKDYYHYQCVKTDKKNDVILIRKFQKA